jgi:hypothetical protein
MQLREAAVSFEKIAEAVGYANRGAAYKAVMTGLKAARLEPAKALRRLEMRRLDRLWMALWPLATANPPDFNALDRCLKIMQRRAALGGLDFHKVALTDPSGEKEFSGGGLTDAQQMAGLRALVEEFRRQEAAPEPTVGGTADSNLGPASGSTETGLPHASG